MNDPVHRIAKGKSLVETKALLTVPLFVESDDAWLELPHFVPSGETRCNMVDNNNLLLPTTVQAYRNQLLSLKKNRQDPGRWIETCLVVVALHAVFDSDCEPMVRTWLCDDGDDDDDDDDLSLAQKTWQDLQSQLKFNLDEWIHIVRAVTTRWAMIPVPHPVHHYSQHQMPHLHRDDLDKAARLLRLRKPSTSVLRLIKESQDKFPPRLWAVVLQDDQVAQSVVQECFPLADWTLDRSNHSVINLVANYDTASNSLPWGVDRLHCRGDSLEDRVRKMKSALLPACLCDRCRYEVDDDDDSIQGQPGKVDRILRLAHGYMGLGDLDRAQTLYQTIRDQTTNCSTQALADAWHALGAIELSKGKFLEAQRTWKSAKAALPSDVDTMHAGLELQWTKMDGYKYFATPTDLQPNAPTLPKYTGVAPNAFVTTVLSSDICDQVIAWANQGTWTKQRHYAVPTNDVPVHTVPHLLSWFNEFMTTTMRPLLAKQFHSSPQYFVHDAFVVRYTATEKSNHLPVHTDESTHSLVIALNDDYEGGGTYFHETDQVVKLRKGEILSFRGDSMAHGGEAVESGQRLIVAVFLYHDDDESAKPKSEKNVSRKRSLPLEGVNELTRGGFSFDFDVPT